MPIPAPRYKKPAIEAAGIFVSRSFEQGILIAKKRAARKAYIN